MPGKKMLTLSFIWLDFDYDFAEASIYLSNTLEVG